MDNEGFPNVEEVTRRLINAFGQADLGNKSDPFDEFLYITLSSKTPPQKYARAFEDLKRAYPQPDAFAESDPSDVALVIQYAGLASKKAEQIVGAARILKNTYGSVTLKPLAKLPTSKAEDRLLELPGVGIKSARCILMYALGRKVFPVDNHCLRIAERLDWIGEANFTRRIADILQTGVPPDLRYDLHVGMVLLGRNHCTPKNPDCPNCPLLSLCPTGQRRVAT